MAPPPLKLGDPVLLLPAGEPGRTFAAIVAAAAAEDVEEKADVPPVLLLLLILCAADSRDLPTGDAYPRDDDTDGSLDRGDFATGDARIALNLGLWLSLLDRGDPPFMHASVSDVMRPFVMTFARISVDDIPFVCTLDDLTVFFARA